MLHPEILVNLLSRQSEDQDNPIPKCDAGNEYDGRLGLRISAILVILVGSAFGEFLTAALRLFYS
jgi:solute carrier family 39 (zinc transporter), member 1/2/3